jgi:predicted nuclease of predicted toxin-antitoxin system
MKLLANENIPIELVNELRNSGYDILRVDEIRKGMKDQEVLEFSLKESRIIITFDKDFGELAVKEKRKATGVILLRMHPESVQYIKERILLLFEKIKELKDKFIVLEEYTIRERNLQ